MSNGAGAGGYSGDGGNALLSRGNVSQAGSGGVDLVVLGHTNLVVVLVSMEKVLVVLL